MLYTCIATTTNLPTRAPPPPPPPPHHPHHPHHPHTPTHPHSVCEDQDENCEAWAMDFLCDDETQCVQCSLLLAPRLRPARPPSFCLAPCRGPRTQRPPKLSCPPGANYAPTAPALARPCIRPAWMHACFGVSCGGTRRPLLRLALVSSALPRSLSPPCSGAWVSIHSFLQSITEPFVSQFSRSRAQSLRPAPPRSGAWMQENCRVSCDTCGQEDDWTWVDEWENKK